MPLVLEIEARSAGRHTLRWMPGPTRPVEDRPAVSGTPLWVAAEPLPSPAAPSLPVAPGAPLAEDDRATWPVTAAAAKPGTVVRLELPEGVYAETGDDLARLRVAAGEREIPYVRWTPSAPALAAGREGLTPQRATEEGVSAVEVPLPAAASWSALELRAAPGPIARSVRALVPSAPRAGVPPRPSWESGWSPWQCAASSNLPCRLELPPPPRRDGTLRLEVRDGDNPPLSRLDLLLWRQRDQLVFLWPASAAVRLVALGEGRRAPRYDLEVARDALLASPWSTAEVVLSEPPAPSSWTRWALVAALVLAGGFLVALLRRLLGHLR